MFILHLALGGCLKTPPVTFGLTADTGGHIAYILDAALAQARHPGVDRVSIVTRLFQDARLPTDHARVQDRLDAVVTIDRIATDDLRYLEKEDLAADLLAFTDAFCRHIRQLPRRPDVIHAHFADAAAVAIVARRRFGIPIVYTPHSLGIDKRRQHVASAALDLRITAERSAIAAADAIIVSTHDEADQQVRAYGIATEGRIHCLPPGVPQRPPVTSTGPLTARLAEWLDDPAKPILLAIARPVAKKNLAGLVRAFAASPALRAAANLVILAGQQDRPCSDEERAILSEIATLCADPALRGRVALPVRHDADDVTALYALAASGGIFVNPAWHEPFGLTLIEAAAAGVPVVATRNGGPSEIIANLGHGLLVDPHDDQAIATACLAIVVDPAAHARFAAAARANIHRYDWTRYAAGSVALYAASGLKRPPERPALLACDIDNTLTGCVEGVRAFADWHAATALPFVVATGRSFDMARTILVRWGLPEPDAFIVDVGTRIMIRAADGAWREWTDYTTALDAGWHRPAIVAALAPLALTPQPDETAGPHKLSFFGKAADADRIRAALTAAGLEARVIFSHDRLIDVIAPAGGKAAAVAAYAGRLGLSLAACVAAGDSGNDADMLDACGHAIVVANASAELAGLTPRAGLHRVRARHAAGILEGLAELGLAPAATPVSEAA